MCCEECHKYYECEEIDKLKENCCKICTEYYDCAAKVSSDEEPDVDEYN